MKRRGFEVAAGWEGQRINLPRRATKYSAGYDIEAAADITVPTMNESREPTLIPTGLKVYCQPDEYLLIANRSSGAKRGLVLTNGIGIIDADYYNNAGTGGHFQIMVHNVTDHAVKIKKGERIAQAVFQKFLIIDGDQAQGERKGGIGSTS